ncbi:N-acetylmuramoyl-L-alanine amidase [Methylomonas sp. HW2-6]|uniref:N-acetylmuramoyl-L-alanine amidase n=1 Tax=Methylomonas sp. HW2-6 TaxID=3376687 RepID=UPI004041C7DC
MQRIYRIFWIWGLLLPAVSAAATQAELGAVSYTSADRVVFSLSGPARHHAFVLKSPSRLVVDFTGAKLAQAISQPPADHPLFAGARSAMRGSGDLRVVVELKADADAKVVMQGNALQVDLAAKPLPTVGEPVALVREKTAIAAMPPLPAPEKSPKRSETAIKPVAMKAANKAKGRNIVVAIDAGHGGKDVGAQGPNGTQEKDVVFAIARNLENLVNAQPGMKAVMIRNGDYFVKLDERRRIARAAKADLFVSIHADAFSDSQAHGASVYTLATKGASSAGAGWLAASENAVDGAAGAGDDRNETLASVLMDLSSKAAKEASQNVGNKVLRSVKGVGHLHRSAVQKAGFVVLKSQEIPSILVETAFISNPEEERRLTSKAYQYKMAAAVFNGIVGHFKQYAPADTLMAQLNRSAKAPRMVALNSVPDERPLPAPAAKSRVEAKALLADNDAAPAEAISVVASGAGQTQHVINRGETLSGIAQHYGVSMRALRLANSMNDGNVRVGQVLQIPRDS